MKREEPRPVAFFRAMILIAAVALTACAFIFHSFISTPSIYIDSPPLASARLSVDGVDQGQASFPVVMTPQSDSVVRLTVDLTETQGPKDMLLVATSFPHFSVIENGKVIEHGGSGEGDQSFYSAYHTNELVHIIALDGTESPDSLVIEFTNPSDELKGHSFTIDSLTVSSTFGIFSRFRIPASVTVFTLVSFLTITVLIAAAMLALHRAKDIVRLVPLLLCSITLFIQCLVSNPVRMFMLQNDQFWQQCDMLSSAVLPLVLLAMARQNSVTLSRHSRAAEATVLLPLWMVILSFIMKTLGIHGAHSVFHLVKPASLVCILVLTVMMLADRKEEKTRTVLYQAASQIILSVALASEMFDASTLDAYISLRSASLTIRLVSIVCYMTFTLSDHLRRKMIVIGQIQLDSLLYRDSLTGCLNRRSFESLKDDEDELKKPVAVVMFDINDLKMVNDSYGHRDGDRLLHFFGTFIQDTLPECRTFRHGGDEFVTLIPPDSLPADLDVFLDESVASPFAINAPFSTSLSYGWALYTGNGKEDFEKAVSMADSAMYDYKKRFKENRSRLSGGEA